MSIDAHIYQQVQSYCKWANLERPALFFEKAAEYIFAKDEKWKNRNKPASTKPASVATKSSARPLTKTVLKTNLKPTAKAKPHKAKAAA